MTSKIYSLSSQETKNSLDSLGLLMGEINRKFAKITQKTLFNGSQPQKSPARIFLAYREEEPNKTIAYALAHTLKQSGFSLFFASRQSLCLGNNWSQQIEAQYQQCDYLILLLSQDTLVSELVTEGLKQALAVRQARPNHKPIIIGIRVNVPLDAPLCHELQDYLNQIQQFEWHSGQDISQLIEVILNYLAQPLRETPQAPSAAQFYEKQEVNKMFYCLASRPLPSTEPELIPQDISAISPFYIKRNSLEQKCYQELTKPGSLIRICAPRQMGKTSLLNQILAHVSQENYNPILLDFQKLDRNILKDLKQLLIWCCMNISRQFNFNFDLDEHWDDDIGEKASMSFFLQTYILAKTQNPIVLVLEEVSELFEQVSVAQDFLTLLRSWHEKAKTHSIWAKMRLVIVQSTESYIPLTINQSPLNVGLGINLRPFTREEVKHLALRYGVNLTPQQLHDLISLVGGNPYLIRLSLYHLFRQEVTINELLAMVNINTGIYSDHLHRLLWKLHQNLELARAFKRVLSSHVPIDLEQIQGVKLKSLGLVTLKEDKYIPSSLLYRRYFSDRLNIG